MADYTVEVNLSDHKLGDRWVGISSIGPVTINSSTPSNSLTRIVLTFKKSHHQRVVYDSSESGSPITITNASTWEASVAEIDEFLSESGDWNWDMAFYESSKTNPLTLYKGTLSVLSDE